MQYHCLKVLLCLYCFSSTLRIIRDFHGGISGFKMQPLCFEAARTPKPFKKWLILYLKMAKSLPYQKGFWVLAALNFDSRILNLKKIKAMGSHYSVNPHGHPGGIIGLPKLSKMVPSFSPRNLRIFENYPQQILDANRCSHSHLKFREFSRISQESSKILKGNICSTFLRAVGVGGALVWAQYLLSGLWKQGGT